MSNLGRASPSTPASASKRPDSVYSVSNLASNSPALTEGNLAETRKRQSRRDEVIILSLYRESEADEGNARRFVKRLNLNYRGNDLLRNDNNSNNSNSNHNNVNHVPSKELYQLYDPFPLSPFLTTFPLPTLLNSALLNVPIAFSSLMRMNISVESSPPRISLSEYVFLIFKPCSTLLM